MVGITAFGAYVPLYRLGKGTQGWTAANERAIANFDEDSITMAVAAALDCLHTSPRGDVDGLFFATTSSPYLEKQASPLIAVACDLREELATADYSHSLRAGTTALRAALDAVKAGSAKKVLVTAADLRVPQPRSEFDATVGDGAAAVMIGDSGVVATVEDSYSLSHEIMDIWRSQGDSYLRSWEDRFVIEEGYIPAIVEAATAIMKRNSLTPKDFSRVILYAPDGRRHADVARRLGFDPKTQLAPGFFDQVGNTGAALALMILAAVLEEAKPQERLLFLNYGQGADAFILRVTEEIRRAKPSRGLKGFVASKKLLPDYQTYLKWRELVDIAPQARRPPLPVPSATALFREQEQNIRFYGVKCKRCGTPQYPIQRVCTICQAKDDFEPYRFSDKQASLFTYSLDYLGPTLDPPLIVSIIDFEGGGRAMCMMTDRDVKEVRVGLPLEMSFRKLHTVEGIHNYFWKCIPVRA